MAMESVSAAGGNIEVMFLQQMGEDPFIPTPERTAQIGEVAARIARFIGEARETLDIAIYDFRLSDEAAAIITDALRERARNKVAIRIIYDAATDDSGEIAPGDSPARLEADRKPPGTESFVQSLSDIAQIEGVTGYRVLMHDKYIDISYETVVSQKRRSSPVQRIIPTTLGDCRRTIFCSYVRNSWHPISPGTLPTYS